MSDYLVTVSRGQHHQTVLVRGDIAAWLKNRGARSTKRGHTLKGWRVDIEQISDGVVDTVSKITDINYGVSA